VISTVIKEPTDPSSKDQSLLSHSSRTSHQAPWLMSGRSSIASSWTHNGEEKEENLL